MRTGSATLQWREEMKRPPSWTRVPPHLLARPLAVEKTNQVWVGAITSVWTAAGW